MKFTKYIKRILIILTIFLLSYGIYFMFIKPSEIVIDRIDAEYFVKNDGNINVQEKIKYTTFKENNFQKEIKIRNGEIENIEIFKVYQGEEIKLKNILEDKKDEEEQENKEENIKDKTNEEVELNETELENAQDSEAEVEVEELREKSTEEKEFNIAQVNDEKRQEIKMQELEKLNSKLTTDSYYIKKIENKYYLGIRINDSKINTSEFKLKYNIKNGAIKHHDVTDINLDLIYDTNYNINKFNVYIEAPDNIKKEELDSWKIGVQNIEENINRGNMYIENKGKIKRGKSLNYRMMLPEYLMSGIERPEKDAKDTILEEQEELQKIQDEINIEEENRKNMLNNINIILFILFTIIFASFLITTLIRIFRNLKKRNDIKKVISTFAYFKQMPEEIEDKYTRMTHFYKADNEVIFLSLLLNLVSKNVFIPVVTYEKGDVNLFADVFAKSRRVKNRKKKNISLSTIAIKDEIDSSNLRKENIIDRLGQEKEEIYKREYKKAEREKKKKLYRESKYYDYVIDLKVFQSLDDKGLINEEEKFVFEKLKRLAQKEKDNVLKFNVLKKHLEKNFNKEISPILNEMKENEKIDLIESEYFEKDSNKKKAKGKRRISFTNILILILLVPGVYLASTLGSILNAIIYLIIISILDIVQLELYDDGITLKGMKIRYELEALKKYIKNAEFLSEIDENNLNKIKQYLIFAEYFSVADEVLEKVVDLNYDKLGLYLTEDEIDKMDNEINSLEKFIDYLENNRSLDELLIVSYNSNIILKEEIKA